jgi:hypothetical protein
MFEDMSLEMWWSRWLDDKGNSAKSVGKRTFASEGK